MSYKKPKDVCSPKYLVTKVEPIVDRGEWEHSVAILQWEDKPKVAVRWNGGIGEDGKIHPGCPQSNGYSTWFLLPCEYEVPFMKAIQAQGKNGVGSIDNDIDVDGAMDAIGSFFRKRGE